MVGQAAILGRGRARRRGQGAVKEDQAGGTAGAKALRQATAWLLGELEGSGLKCGREGSTGGGCGKRWALQAWVSTWSLS